VDGTTGNGNTGQIATSKRALARAVGRDPSTVAEWMKDKRWPFPIVPPWDVDEVRHVWMQNTQRRSKADTAPRKTSKNRTPAKKSIRPQEAEDGDPLYLARVRKEEASAIKIERANAVFAHEFIRIEDARAEIAGLIAMVRSVLLTEPRAVADALDAMGLLADGARQAIEQELERRARGVCHRLATGLDEVLEA